MGDREEGNRTMSKYSDLSALRHKIDEIDDELLGLLNRRASLTNEVGIVKRAESKDVEFYRPEREAEILRRLVSDNSGPLTNDVVVRLMKEIISECLALEQKLKVSYLGPLGTYTHAATLKQFGGAVTLRASKSIEEIFREVESCGVDYGVVPIENSVGGTIYQSLDALKETSAFVCGEVVLAIHHQLLGTCELESAKRIYGHEQALQQCAGWLEKNLNEVEQIAVSSNAVAAEIVSQSDGKDCVAIASSEAGKIYMLPIVARNIEDSVSNTTRFIVLGRNYPARSGDDKSMIMFGLPNNKAGALHAALGVLAENNINMSKIESRPSKNGVWDYLFFADLVGHANDPSMADALAEIKENSSIFKLLGSYPRCDI